MCTIKSLNCDCNVETPHLVHGMIDAHAHHNSVNTLPWSLQYVQIDEAGNITTASSKSLNTKLDMRNEEGKMILANNENNAQSVLDIIKSGKLVDFADAISGHVGDTENEKEKKTTSVISTIMMARFLVEQNTRMYCGCSPKTINYKKLSDIRKEIEVLLKNKNRKDGKKILPQKTRVVNGKIDWEVKKGDDVEGKWNADDLTEYNKLKNIELETKGENFTLNVPSLIITPTMDMGFVHKKNMHIKKELDEKSVDLINDGKKYLESWNSQIKNTENAVLSNPLRLFPLFSYDPRRYCLPNEARPEDNIGDNKDCELWREPFTRIIEYWDSSSDVNKIWLGFYMNPQLGFRPFDEKCVHLADFYKECADNNIPILVNCAPGGITACDAKSYQVSDSVERRQDKSNQYCGTGQVVNDLKYDHFYRNYGHPENWRQVLEVKDYKNLRLCLAGFGGNSEWKRESMTTWAEEEICKNKNCEQCARKKEQKKCVYSECIQPPTRQWIRSIIRLTRRYDNVYVDISGLNISDDGILSGLDKLLRMIHSDHEEYKHLKYKLIFGSGWYFSSLSGTKKTYGEQCTEIKALFDNVDKTGAFWERVSLINPWKFYRLTDGTNVKDYTLKKMYDELERLLKNDERKFNSKILLKKMKEVFGLDDKEDKGLIKYINTNKDVYSFKNEQEILKGISEQKKYGQRGTTYKENNDDVGCNVIYNDDIILEINIRLAGFGGLLPTDEFTELTKKGVIQFQKDYMKRPEDDKNLGIVDSGTLTGISKFSNLFRENLAHYMCPCINTDSANTCNGFGTGRFKDRYRLNNYDEKSHMYEYPGMHQSLLWAVSALRFYTENYLHTVGREGDSRKGISSGYRCWYDNERHLNHEKKPRSTTNHMGKAVDIQFKGIYAPKNATDTIGAVALLKNVFNEIVKTFLNAQKEWKYNDLFSIEPLGVDWVNVKTNNSNLWICKHDYIDNESYIAHKGCTLPSRVGDKCEHIIDNTGSQVKYKNGKLVCTLDDRKANGEYDPHKGGCTLRDGACIRQEPSGKHTYSWIHLDVRAFNEKFLVDSFFIHPKNERNYNKECMSEIIETIELIKN